MKKILNEWQLQTLEKKGFNFGSTKNLNCLPFLCLLRIHFIAISKFFFIGQFLCDIFVIVLQKKDHLSFPLSKEGLNDVRKQKEKDIR